VMRRRLVLGLAPVRLLLSVGLLVAVDVGGRLSRRRQVVVVFLAHAQPDNLAAGCRQVGLKLSLAFPESLELTLVRNVLPQELQLLPLQFCDLVSQSFLLERKDQLVLKKPF